MNNRVIRITCLQEDLKQFDEIIKHFSEESSIRYIEERGCDGGAFVHVIITLLPLASNLTDILNYFNITLSSIKDKFSSDDMIYIEDGDFNCSFPVGHAEEVEKIIKARK